jgi:hypothetical protein
VKLRIIDLINKIANNEELPKKIKYDDVIWDYDYTIGDYINEDKVKALIESLFWGNSTFSFINDEVEIIEEDKKIKYPILHKTAPSETTGDQMPNWRNLIDCNFEYLNKTICQLIDEINKLKE